MENLEKELIPLVFVQMNFDGSSVYERLDTGEHVSGEYLEMLSGLEVVNTSYSGVGKIKTTCPIENANGLVLRRAEKEDLTKPDLYTGDYCYFDGEAFKEQEQSSELGSGLSVTR